MTLKDTVAASTQFQGLDKNGQAEMLLWAISEEGGGKIGVDLVQVGDTFAELGFARPNPTRTRDHFRRSKNVRSAGVGRYLPTRPFVESMRSRYPIAVLSNVVPASLDDLPLPPFVSLDRRRDLERMISAYCQLFLLENSMRGLIETVLTASLGPQWWDVASNTTMKRKHADRLQNEQTKKWAPARSDFGPLFSLDWTDLITLMRKYEELFKPHIGEIGFLHRFDDAAMFRHVVAHNGSLRDDDDFALIAIDYRSWIKQVGPTVPA